MDDDLEAHYQDLVEDNRLTRSPHGRLEFLRVQELLRRFLPPAPASIADIGGATGVHAKWLADDGYKVHVIDPVSDHVTAAGHLAGVTAEVGDARTLPIQDNSVDVVLMFGPLYHLEAREDRIQAIREAGRVLRDGGLLAVAVISRYLSLLEVGAAGRLSAEAVEPLRRVILSGEYDGHVGFVRSHWHTADDLRVELTEAGFGESRVLGVEGPAWPALDALGLESFELMHPSAIRAAQLVEDDPHLLHASAHLLGITCRPART